MSGDSAPFDDASLYDEIDVCTACNRLSTYCVCPKDSIKMVEYVEVTMVIEHGDQTTERRHEIHTDLLCAGKRFALINGLDVEEYEVFDYDESAHRLVVYQLTPVDTRPAEMRALADRLNPGQTEREKRTR